jgi:hypothetical protein
MQAQDFLKRQAQWDEFHRWEASGRHIDMSLEQRIAWYTSAYCLSRRYSPRCLTEHVSTKVQQLREMQERLAKLSGA